ncbi:hypothetical protein TNIN_93591 [Trichonephila inaurata madagascariensis]|uniref:Uncharacterized protein n=1 Tax=Trichonephila inaurata madagascariensis TaxID=2747483 RepID=A0A8X7BS59_9ARAC|nr:hypothetical protein TNIN_93591 [Trichonephila inaurata madagascariensis]
MELPTHQATIMDYAQSVSLPFSGSSTPQVSHCYFLQLCNADIRKYITMHTGVMHTLYSLAPYMEEEDLKMQKLIKIYRHTLKNDLTQRSTKNSTAKCESVCPPSGSLDCSGGGFQSFSPPEDPCSNFNLPLNSPLGSTQLFSNSLNCAIVCYNRNIICHFRMKTDRVESVNIKLNQVLLTVINAYFSPHDDFSEAIV